MIKFYDAANVGNIPAGATHVALYFDGLYAAPPGTLPRAAKRWITVDGGTHAAGHAGIADFEPGNPVYSAPGALRSWAAERHLAGHRARIYCDRAGAARALAIVRGLPAIWWISTLDDKQWTAAALVADLRDNWHADIALDDMWANQYAGGMSARYDTSNLFTTW